MIGQIALLICVLVLAWVILFQKRETKFDILQILVERGKPSYTRFGSIVCLGLFVWIVKRSIGLPFEQVNIELILIVGILAFFPKLLQKIVEARIEKDKDNEKV